MSRCLHFMKITDWLILMADQTVWEYFVPIGSGVVFIIYLYLHFMCSYFFEIFCTQLYDFKYSNLIQIICAQLYSFKYSYLNK